ncbi:MAG: DUF5060 domain-containing protein [Acidobacteriota bacterium]|nr:DUF5060 domain-containing protein [Acidobacteriota bacterium]
MINRRQMLKLSSAGSLAALGAATPATFAAPTAAVDHAPVPQWEVFEISLHGPSSGNPFTDVEFSATFILGNRMVPVDGFYDGAGTYKIRFMPDALGEWKYATSSNAPELSGKTGIFSCVTELTGIHGPVRVQNQHHFAYADGTPFYPFGTTCYAWMHQPDALQRQTLASLSAAPFNKVRMCVFPKHYEYNHNEPQLYPFERNAGGKHDFTRPNPAYFAHVEQCIADLRAINIEADLILFHPYDRWGYAAMSAEADDRYLRYVLARMSAYRNIWWSMANEWDLMKAKSVSDFDRFFHIVEQHDSSSHLRSIHYSRVMYDYAHPWVTHGCLQTANFDAAGSWLDAWRKPIVFDEVMYEGNLNRRWGNLSGQEMTRRFWLGIIAGCYVTHGETLLDPNQPLDENTTPTLWWSHGGTLHGTSPARIAFLRKLVEQTSSKDSRHSGFEAQAASYYLNASALDTTGAVQQILYFTDFHQPIYYEFPLPDGRFTAELIDPWEMTVSAMAGTFSGKTQIKLTGRPYQAMRFKRV